MKDIQVTGNDVSYQCGAVKCMLKGEPHTVPKAEVMATLYTLMEELAMREDIRLEALDVVVGMMWNTLYPEAALLSDGPKDAAFMVAYDELKRKVRAVNWVQRLSHVQVPKSMLN